MAPAITLTPNFGKVGDTCVITGTGFTALDAITFTFDVSPIVPTDAPIAADGSGAFTAHIVIPSDTLGAKAVVATDSHAGSDSKNYTIEAVPDAPVITLDDLGQTDYTIEWDAPNSNGNAITGYTVQTATDAGFTSPSSDSVAIGSDPRTLNKTGLVGETNYWIRVKATNGIGDSAWSNVLAVTTESALPIMTLNDHPGFAKTLKSYKEGSMTGLAVADDADTDFALIDMRGCSELMIQIKNTHATNGLTYTIYGTAEEVNTPFAYDSARYSAISGLTGNIAALANVIKTITDNYSWILVRVRRQTSLQNSQCSILARQKQ